MAIAASYFRIWLSRTLVIMRAGGAQDNSLSTIIPQPGFWQWTTFPRMDWHVDPTNDLFLSTPSSRLITPGLIRWHNLQQSISLPLKKT